MVIWRFQLCCGLERKKRATYPRFTGRANGIELWWVKWGGSPEHVPFHCLCLSTAPRLAGGTLAGGTGGLLVSVQGVS